MKSLFVFLYFAIIISLVVAAWQKPYHNWDMLGYMACVVSMNEQNIDSIHAITYNHAKAELSPNDYAALIDPTNSYRKKNVEDAAYFHEQLPLYRVKPLYILLVYLFYKVGVSLTGATVLPSILAYVGLGCLLFFWMMKFSSVSRAFVFGMLVMISPPMWETALSSTPDALAGLIVFLAFYFILERKRNLFGLLLLMIGISVRIDVFVLTMMTAVFLRITKAGNRKITTRELVIFSGMSTLVFCGIAFGPGQFSFHTIGYYTLIQSDFVTQVTSNPLLQYFVLLVKGIYITQHSIILFFLLMAVTTIYVRRKYFSIHTDFETQIIFLLLINIIVRYLLHPTMDDRFLVAHYCIIMIIFIRTIFGKFISEPVAANA